MAPARAPVALPGLARLLAGVPRERLEAIARIWGVDPPSGNGLAGRLYQRMTAPESIDAILATREEAERLVFARALRGDRPVARSDLLRALPFTEENLDRLTDALEFCGLLWRHAASGRSAGGSQRQWQVPRDLRSALASRRLSPRASSHEREPLVPPPLICPDAGPPNPQPSGQVPRLISRFAEFFRPRPSIQKPKSWFTLGVHLAEGLGVWAADGSPGPRHAAWGRASGPGQVRALARLWLVDDSGPIPVSARVRSALWETLQAVEPDRWYTLDSVARRVAWHAAQAGRRPNSLNRQEIEQGVTTLAWLGVLRYAVDSSERPTALSVTPDGRSAFGE